jgi:hypothetical protein
MAMLPAREHKPRINITERRCCSVKATRCCWTSAYEGMKIEKHEAWLGLALAAHSWSSSFT